ncbi:asparaginase [Actinomadura alba]|uniref:asparaginase n=1 Tax=Actinomadura alba TaxID=406431 RepID=UPI0031D20155
MKIPTFRTRRVVSIGSLILAGLTVLTAGGMTSASAAERQKTPKIVVIGTGGTISGVSDTRVSFQTYRSGQLKISDMVAHLQPEIGKVADVSTVQFGNKGSGGYTIKEFYDLTKEVDDELKHADGVVVTTGTDTMEEFAYWLDLTVRSRKPVVLTGSMRPWTVVGTDAPANLYNAITLAASGRTECNGTVIMLNDEIQAARDVTKTNALRMDTFKSREVGVLGYVDETRIRMLRSTPRVQHCDNPSKWATPFDLSKVDRDRLPRVEIVYGYQEAGGEAITAFADAGVRGIVTAGTGSGGVSSAQSAARTAAIAKGVTFVSTTRTGSGASYGGSNGVIPGEDLLPQKARILLLLSLAQTGDPGTIAQWVSTYGVPQAS